MTEPILIQLQRYVRDLLQHPEDFVKAGRQNFDRKQFEQPYIVVDSLSPDVPLASSRKYDDVAEQMQYSELVSRAFTFDFYGLTAAALCSRFRIMARTELSSDLQQDLNITVFHPGAATNVKQLTGQQYGERMQLECQVHYSPSLIVDILRIDIAQLRIIGERGLIYEQ
jgi:hypothetical protein